MPMSPSRRPSWSRSISPVSTDTQSHSVRHGDGYERVPHVSHQNDDTEMTELNRSVPGGHDSTTSSDPGAISSASSGLNKHDINVRSTELPPQFHGDSPLDKAGKFRLIVSKFWLWEILAYCFSIACMGAVIGVLVYEDGKQLDHWYFQITPNAVISFIVTLAKSSFLLAITETISQLKWLHFHSKSRKLSDL